MSRNKQALRRPRHEQGRGADELLEGPGRHLARGDEVRRPRVHRCPRPSRSAPVARGASSVMSMVMLLRPPSDSSDRCRCSRSCHRRRLRRRRRRRPVAVAGRAPGQRQEHLVQRRAPQRDVLHRHLGLVERAHDDRQQLRTAGRGERAAARRRVGRRLGHPERRRAPRPPAACVGDVDRVQLDHVGADPRLELVRRALRDDAAAVDDDDERGEVVGLIEILRRQHDVGPAPAHVVHGVPHLVAAPRVEARRRLVEQQQPGRADEARPEVESPSHPAGIGPDLAVGGLHQIHLLEDPLGRGHRLGAALAVQAGHHDEVLPAGHHLLDGGGLAGEADHAAHAPSGRARRRAR